MEAIRGYKDREVEAKMEDEESGGRILDEEGTAQRWR
jgi:hypothetical protein